MDDKEKKRPLLLFRRLTGLWSQGRIRTGRNPVSSDVSTSPCPEPHRFRPGRWTLGHVGATLLRRGLGPLSLPHGDNACPHTAFQPPRTDLHMPDRISFRRPVSEDPISPDGLIVSSLCDLLGLARSWWRRLSGPRTKAMLHWRLVHMQAQHIRAFASLRASVLFGRLRMYLYSLFCSSAPGTASCLYRVSPAAEHRPLLDFRGSAMFAGLAPARRIVSRRVIPFQFRATPPAGPAPVSLSFVDLFVGIWLLWDENSWPLLFQTVIPQPGHRFWTCAVSL